MLAIECTVLAEGRLQTVLYGLFDSVHPYAGAYDWCTVPDSSYDVVLFGGLAVVLACLLQGKLNTLMVLVAGNQLRP